MDLPMQPSYAHIVTVDEPRSVVLWQKTEDIQPDEFPLALEIGNQLMEALKPYTPASGLAAPQIGISKSVFIFSYNRDPKNLEVVINPTFTPIGIDVYVSWEGCFSVMLKSENWQLAKIPRFEKIHVRYMNASGEIIEKDLEGFSAKVFQHECDHLNGIVNIYRKDAEIKSFESKEELSQFMANVKEQDAKRYNRQ